MRHKKVSVIVPTYNQAEYLGACLDSIWFQDYPELEIVVVADPSPDDTSAVLAEFAAGIERDMVSYASKAEADGSVSRTQERRYRGEGRELVVIENPERLGHTPSYNLGFKTATGEYGTYVASDDICHPQMISTLASALEERDVDFAYSDMFIVDDAMRILREFRLPDYSFEASFCDWYLCGVSKLYKLALHDRYGLYDEAYTANDHECYLRFAMNGVRFHHVPKVLYSVRSHDQRTKDVHSSAGMDKLFAESRKLVETARAFARSRKSAAGDS
ncbi:glycosyltransferase family 2 protein [Desulfovibrio caledoniensis]